MLRGERSNACDIAQKDWCNSLQRDQSRRGLDHTDILALSENHPFRMALELFDKMAGDLVVVRRDGIGHGENRFGRGGDAGVLRYWNQH